MAEIEDVMDKLDDVLDRIADNKEQIEAQRSVQRYCHHCGGDGNKIMDEGAGSCPECGGDGYRKFARITLTSEE